MLIDREGPPTLVIPVDPSAGLLGAYLDDDALAAGRHLSVCWGDVDLALIRLGHRGAVDNMADLATSARTGAGCVPGMT